jgi:hypothetical protein
MKLTLSHLLPSVILLGAALEPLSAQTTTTTAAASCLVTFDSTIAAVRSNYAGYRIKVAEHEAELAALTDSIRTATQRASDWATECFPAIRRWVGYFRDPHMIGPWQAAPHPAGGDTSAAVPPALPDTADLPTIQLLDDSTTYVRLPALDIAVKPWIDSTFGQERAALLARPYMIVDVRGDGGGCTCSYDSLAPLLYSKPVHNSGMDVWSSPANIAYWQSLVDRKLFSHSQDAAIRRAIREMKSHPHQLITLTPASVDQRDTIYPLPRRVAILIDRGCASSCESLVIEGRQSDKVVILGKEHTAGVFDYGNIRKVRLPGWREMMIPTTHERNSHIDLVGLAPDVQIPDDVRDEVAFARRYLRSDN